MDNSEDSSIKYTKLVSKLRDSKNLFRFLERAKNEDDVIVELANVLECKDEISLHTEVATVRVDLIFEKIAIEVEYEIEKPWIGLDQALAYSILLQRPSVLLHVLRYVSQSYKDSFRKILNSLEKCIDIRGLIIDIGEKKIIA